MSIGSCKTGLDIYNIESKERKKKRKQLTVIDDTALIFSNVLYNLYTYFMQ
jgi:hypothetical protein